MAIVASVSDVHSPLYLKEFLSKLGLRVRDSDCFLMAGDMILHSRVSQFDPVLRAVRKLFSGKLISIFGNEEHDGVKDALKERYRDVTWLDDSEVNLGLGGRKVRIVGTRGTLAQPTSWQKAHVPDIEETYAKRVPRVREMLTRRKDDDLVILLCHYAPVRATIEGEDGRIRPFLTDERMEKVIEETSPDIVIHGHGHNATVLSAEMGNTKVFNVAFPARRAVTIIELG